MQLSSMVQGAENLVHSLKKYLILKYLHNVSEVDGMMYMLKIKHMLELFVSVKHDNF